MTNDITNDHKVAYQAYHKAVKERNELADTLTRVTGQLRALQQANASLVVKWRGKSLKPGAFAFWECADQLKAATKEATK